MSNEFPNIVDVITPAVVGKVSSWDEVKKEEVNEDATNPLYIIGNDELDPDAEFEEVARVAIGKDGKPMDVTLE